MMTFISFSCTIFNQTQNNDCSHSDYKTIIKKNPNLFPPRILRALQQRVFGLQLGQLPAQAVDFVLQLLVVFDDVNHFIVGLIQALGGTVPAKKHSCREKINSDQSFTIKP